VTLTGWRSEVGECDDPQCFPCHHPRSVTAKMESGIQMCGASGGTERVTPQWTVGIQ
jgi:hypothetical protein